MADYRPRLSVEITEEQQKALNNLIPWGLQKRVMSVIISDLVSVLQRGGNLALANILDKSLKLKDYSPTFKELSDGDNQELRSVDQSTQPD